jgi:hypothetical protein
VSYDWKRERRGKPGAAPVSSWRNEPAYTKPSIEFKGDNNAQYCKPIFSSRIRLIAVLGFRRRRRWRPPFTATVFEIERRLLGMAP